MPGGDAEDESRALAALERELDAELARGRVPGDRERRGLERDLGPAEDSVEPLVAEDEAARRHLDGEAPSAPGPLASADLEQVLPVARELEREGQGDRLGVVVRDDDLDLEPLVVERDAPDDVEHVAREPVRRVEVAVRHLDLDLALVARELGDEEGRARPADLELERREVPRPSPVEPELARRVTREVADHVRHDEGAPVQERVLAVERGDDVGADVPVPVELDERRPRAGAHAAMRSVGRRVAPRSSA